jgi:hypothetical protein
MDDPLDGQIVPALGQWQGALLILATLLVPSLVRMLKALR